ncbi:MAG: tRNA dihydrouridine synthase DusB [Bacteroidetes bacterium]|nr:MAG: tRNA dihydrouridine synthase DusB [Bacteroidota bacterium]
MIRIENIELGEFPVILAPMEDVTDSAFRSVCKDFGADLMYTEFISSEGLIRDAFKSTRKLDFLEKERPIGIQIFGHQKDSMIAAAKVSEAAQPNLIDINYGCPVKKVVSKGAGAAFLKDLPRMVEMTKAVIDAVDLPVTIKTRLGWDEDSKNIVEVAKRMQEIGVKAIAIHGRTRSQLYKGDADWELIGAVKNDPEIEIPIFGNGDITTAEEAIKMKSIYGVDGVMIGRGAMGNPWIFSEIKALLKGETYQRPNMEERVKVCKAHYLNSIEVKGNDRTLKEMRKHYGNYFKGYHSIKPWRMKLVTAPNQESLFGILNEMIGEFGGEGYKG